MSDYAQNFAQNFLAATGKNLQAANAADNKINELQKELIDCKKQTVATEVAKSRFDKWLDKHPTVGKALCVLGMGVGVLGAALGTATGVGVGAALILGTWGGGTFIGIGAAVLGGLLAGTSAKLATTYKDKYVYYRELATPMTNQQQLTDNLAENVPIAS